MENIFAIKWIIRTKDTSVVYRDEISHNSNTKHIQIQTQIQFRRTLLFQVRTHLLIPGFGPWRHEERDTILIMLTPPQHAAHLVMFKITVGRDPKNPTTSFNGKDPTPSFQNPQILGTFSSGHDVISCLGVYYDKWWFSYPLRANVKLHPMTMHLDYETRILQSPTKLNDKINLTKNY